MADDVGQFEFRPLHRPYDIGPLLIHNVLRGDVGGALGSFGDLKDLSPTQRGQYVVDPDGWRPTGRDPVSTILRVATNPLIIMGVVLGMRYGYGPASGMLKRINTYTKGMFPGLYKLKSFRGIFGNTAFGDLMEEVVEVAHNFKTKIRTTFGNALYDHKLRAGHSANYAEQVATVAQRIKLQDPNNPLWSKVRDAYRRQKYFERFGENYSRMMKAGALPEVEAQIERTMAGVVKDPRIIARNFSPELDRGISTTLQSSLDDILDATSPTGERGGWNIAYSRAHKLSGKSRDEALKSLGTIRKMGARRIYDYMDNLGVDLSGGAGRKAWLKTVSEGDLETIRQKIAFGAQEGYWPHVATRDHRNLDQALREALYRTPTTSEAARQQKKLLAAAEPVVGPGKKKLGALIPDYDELARDLPGAFSDDIMEMLRMVQKTTGPGTMNSFSLRAANVLDNYGHFMGKNFAWTAKGLGQQIVDEVKGPMATEASRNMFARMRYNLALDTYIPVAMGKLGPGETLYAMGWSAHKAAAHEFFASDRAKSLLPGGLADWFRQAMEKPAIQNLTVKNAGAKIASYLYASTLGLNPASAGLNLMQNLMTTTGVVPPKYMARGMKEVAKKGQRFLKLYSEGGLSMEKAFFKAFPEWETLGGATETELLYEMSRAKAGGTSISAKVARAQQFLLSAFTGTERFNKLWAYHSGRAWGLAEGMAAEEAGRVGMKVMELTQFPGGPLGTSAMMVNWWPPFRQFMQFPTRLAELFTRDWGTAGRMMTAAGLTYEAGQMMGLDLSRGLLVGAMPLPEYENAPLYPIPLIPPVVQMGAGLVEDLAQGKFEQTRRSLPLLFPGGVSLARMSTAMSPAMAEKLGRAYADYTEVRPDGTVPVYTGGGNLKGYMSPIRLWAEALGWKTLTGDPEGELSQYLLRQRDKIRTIKRDYIEAIARNKTTRAREINRKYQKLYPQLGPIRIKESDIRAVHLRHDVSRVERVLETMPPDIRAEMGGAVQTALMHQADTGAFFGVDPELLQRQATITSRDQYRLTPRRSPTQRVQRAFSSQEALRPSAEHGISRAGFSGFPGFME